ICAWAISHAFGVGEILVLLLLIAGVVTLGKSAWDLAHLLRAFAATALSARTTSELDEAAQYFAKAVVTGGLDVVIALLLHCDLKTVRARFAQGYSVRPNLL